MLTKLKTLMTKDLLTRAVLTFFQAFIGALLLVDEPLTTTALVGAAGSALSIVYHTVVAPLLGKAKTKLRK